MRAICLNGSAELLPSLTTQRLYSIPLHRHYHCCYCRTCQQRHNRPAITTRPQHNITSHQQRHHTAIVSLNCSASPHLHCSAVCALLLSPIHFFLARAPISTQLMSFLLGVGASLLSAASQQLVSYFEYEVQQAEIEEEEQQQQRHQHRQPNTQMSPPRRVSLPSHRLLSSPAPPTPPHSTTLLSSPTHSLLSTSALFNHSAPSTTHPTCTCTTDHTTPADYTLTPFNIEFATALSDHPTTFHSFPACCEWSGRFHLSAVQLVHARRLLSECVVFGELRSEVRSVCGVSEFEFWRVYFLLLHNVLTRERRQRTTPTRGRRGRGGRERRSTRGQEGEQEDKENVSPALVTREAERAMVREGEQPAKRHSMKQQYEEEKEAVVEVGVEEDEQQRYEQERAVWAEVDHLILTLTSASLSTPTAHTLRTPCNTTHLAATSDHSSTATLNDSACSDYYESPSPQKPAGQLFHRLTADEQQSVAELLTTQQRQQWRVDDDEQREVSRLVFSPTPSLDGSMCGDEWEGLGVDVDDSVSELDVSACTVSSISDYLASDSVHDLSLSDDDTGLPCAQ